MSPKTAIILIDPLNDFIHPDGKLFSRVEESVKATGTVDNLLRLVNGARNLRIPIYYGLHQPYRDGSYDGWNHMKETHLGLKKFEIFKVNSWGGEIHTGLEPDLENGDVVVSRHWNSSSFANTDLDYQLRQRDISHVVCAGMVANTCLETTARYALELKDATAGFSQQLKEAATDLVLPTIVEEVLNVDDWINQEKRKALLE
ncbi:hypothetical protein N7451_009756 [Penicillium sp. IBT 35674x]|nr:hypothetical protein N7451_009756 [Penicillium sp. IBT 35674x]